MILADGMLFHKFNSCTNQKTALVKLTITL